MHLSFSTQHIHNLGESIQNYAKERLTEILHKYIHLEKPDIEQLLTVKVHFSKDLHGFKCNIIVSQLVKGDVLKDKGVSKEKGHVLKCEGVSQEIDDAFDQAIHKLEKLLKKYQSRLKDHHSLKTVEAEEAAIKYVIHSSDELSEGDIEDPPITIDEKPISIKPMSVHEAIMIMDLENLPAVMFINKKTKRTNVVYYRKDGNISWIDHKS